MRVRARPGLGAMCSFYMAGEITVIHAVVPLPPLPQEADQVQFHSFPA